MPQANATPKTIAIIGPGNIGLALANCLSKRHQIYLAGRDIKETQAKANLLDNTVSVMSMHEAAQQADLVLLTVTDQAITSVAESLQAHFKHDAIITHCSGALSSEILNSVKADQRKICSLHPLNTFPNIAASLGRLIDHQHGTYLYCEGDRQALTITDKLFSASGFNTITIKPDAKTLYHAACVFACNYLNSLMEASLQTAESAGIERDQFWQSLQPILHSTLQNINSAGTAESLSGPIARTDQTTIAKHLEALDNNTPLTALYQELGKVALTMLLDREDININQNAAKTIKSLLSS